MSNQYTLVDLTGQRFGRLLVLSRLEPRNRRSVWLCSCDCGTVKGISQKRLRTGHTRSCGCLKREAGARNIQKWTSLPPELTDRYPTFTEEQLRQEEWRTIGGYEGFYSVSSLGRIRRDIAGPYTYVGRLLSPNSNHTGYMKVTLNARGHRQVRQVHQLVARAFMGPPPRDMTVNHINGIKTDNRSTNLEYLTGADNIRHGFANGLMRPRSGDDHWSRQQPQKVLRGERAGGAKILDSDIEIIRYLLASGMSQQAIAKRFGVSQTHISRIKRRTRRAV